MGDHVRPFFSMTKKVVFVITLVALACNRAGENTIAVVNNVSITAAEVDNLIDQELYQTLQRVYVLRRTAVEELIFKKLVDIEAKAQGISAETLLEKEINSKISPENIEQYIEQQNLEARGIPLLNNGYRLVDVRSSEGQLLVYQDYKKFLTSRLYETLKAKHDIRILLNPPIEPEIRLTNIPVLHERGNINSNVSLIEISDLECESCKMSHPIYEAIFQEYEDKIKFSFTHFSSAVTLAATISEAASLQGKFWEMRNAIFDSKRLKANDTSSYLVLALNLGLDTARLKKDIGDLSLYNKINENISYLHTKRFFATPTLLLNGRLITDVTNFDALRQLINKELNK